MDRDKWLLERFEEWKAEPAYSIGSAFGRTKVTLKGQDGSTRVVEPMTFDEWMEIAGARMLAEDDVMDEALKRISQELEQDFEREEAK